jgi:sugar/nucleoside kinase (ribokinase family)
MQSPHDFTNEVWSFFASRKKGSVCLVEKRDKRGARAWLADRACDMPPQAELEPLDDTGSGDVFDGTFLVARQRGRDLSEALALANRAAGEALAVPGTQLDKDRFAALKASLT